LNKKIFVFFIIIIFGLYSYSINASNNIHLLENRNSIKIQENILSADLKIRKIDGDWEDNQISAKVGTTLEFKISLILEGDYQKLFIIIELPTIGNNITTMFEYILGSATNKPSGDEGTFFGTNRAVIWAWESDYSTWPKIYTFKAKIIKSGIKNVNLTVVATRENLDPLNDLDHVKVTGEKKSKIFEYINKYIDSSTHKLPLIVNSNYIYFIIEKNNKLYNAFNNRLFGYNYIILNRNFIYL